MNRSVLFAWSTLVCAGSCAVSFQNVSALTFNETGGKVVVEAEHFDSRVADVANGKAWTVIPDESASSVSFTNPQGGKFVQALPDTGLNTGGSGTAENSLPSISYKVQINTTGLYHLYVRADSESNNSASDSFWGHLSGQTDYYGFPIDFDTDFSTNPWLGVGLKNSPASPVGATDPSTWNIAAPGVYTITINMREDGSALDALVLQLDSLAAPTATQTESATVAVPEPASMAIVALGALALLRRRPA